MGTGFLRLGLAIALVAGLGCSLQTAGEEPAEETVDPGTVHDADGGGEVDGDARGDDAVAFDDAADRPGGHDDATDDDAPADDDATDDDTPADDDAGGDVACPPGVPEICNGLDDDCDGNTDEGMECVLGTESSCGPCALGRRSCTATCTWSECSYAPEVCEPGTSEACTPPSCAIGTRTCETGCGWGPCVPNHTDCTTGATRSCTVSSCGSGMQACAAECTWGGCVVSCSRSGETCCPGVGCVDLSWDPSHCGSCDNACGFLSGCTDGSCWW